MTACIFLNVVWTKDRVLSYKGPGATSKHKNRERFVSLDAIIPNQDGVRESVRWGFPDTDA